MRLTRATNVSSRIRESATCQLRVLSGANTGTSVRLPPVGVVVGADATADVVLADDAVSGRHCAVVPTASGFEVRDLGSRNGTFIDGVAIEKAAVPVGAVLRVGHSLIQLLPEQETVSIPPSDSSSFGAMMGGSLAMRQVYALLERASSTDASILFLGESGTGKELAARAVHDASTRSDGPFVVFDCGAASENLIESALFGHVKGAFTGAQTDRAGAFAAAHGGTLFLDEIGDLPLQMQPKLLRMLESSEVTPLGTHTAERYDVRVVAATHHDVFEEVESGAFRGDLYYRLAVVEVGLPPLRQRSGDLPALIEKFLVAAGAEPSPIEGDGLARLEAYHWPGNVRELRNVITRGVALGAPGAPFSELPILLRSPARSDDSPPAVSADRPFSDAKADIVARFERAYLTDLLHRADNNISEAARQAGVERKYLYKLLDKHGLR